MNTTTIANRMENDIREAIGIYNGYDVNRRTLGRTEIISITPNDGLPFTSAAITTAQDVINPYKAEYSGVMYWFDTEKIQGNDVPAMVINVNLTTK